MELIEEFHEEGYEKFFEKNSNSYGIKNRSLNSVGSLYYTGGNKELKFEDIKYSDLS
jgi:hypothetical protein